MDENVLQINVFAISGPGGEPMATPSNHGGWLLGIFLPVCGPAKVSGMYQSSRIVTNKDFLGIGKAGFSLQFLTAL